VIDLAGIYLRRVTIAAMAACCLTSVAISTPNPVHAVTLLNGLGGATGYGEGELASNDDQSTGDRPLPFPINFFGKVYNNFYVNNNGSISFGSPVGEFTPSAFPGAPAPIIAPYWADVDTTNQPGGGRVFFNLDDPSALVVTWSKVGYFSGNNDRLNDFQLVLNNRGGGDFDFEFRYAQLQWTTGDLSGGTNGLGGTRAVAGYDAGNGVDYAVLPGSLSDDVLKLVETGNSPSGSPGLWQFRVKDGNPDIPTSQGVPGPLPFTGALTAFAWSRRVRMRVRNRCLPIAPAG
jgi:hypothetical protein